MNQTMSNTIDDGWRILAPHEPVEKGDEYEITPGTWRESGNWNAMGRPQQPQTRYRRRTRAEFRPCSYLNPVVPPVKTHVVWAETPAVKHCPKDHMDADPGEGYRLVTHGEFIEEGDQWWDHDLGAWGIFTGLSLASATKHCIKSPLRRKLPEPKLEAGEGYRLLGPDEPWEIGDECAFVRNALAGLGWYEVKGVGEKWTTSSYNAKWPGDPVTARRKIGPTHRPYANAAEAAKGLEGKLVSNRIGVWMLVNRVDTMVMVGGVLVSFETMLAKYTFTDGTPCGIRTN